MVYLERKRLAERDAAEAAGADLWTDVLDRTVRTKVYAALMDIAVARVHSTEIEIAVQRMHRVEAGISDPPAIAVALFDRDTDLTISYIEAIGVAIEALAGKIYWSPQAGANWCAAVARIFEAHRIKFKFIDGQVVPLGSEIMHADVIEPALVLLHGRSEFAKSEKAFRDALEELTGGKPDDAITDAGTALQEALTAVGCKGHALGDLIKDAKNNGWFGPRDSPLADGIAKIHNWVAAERNAGEAHRASDVTKDDAWFVVHVVGAAIVRLAAGPRTS